MNWRILCGDVRTMLQTLPAESVQTCVTSPPFWGLRDYGHGEQIGLEPTPDAYVQQLVAVFREVRRVLRDDGCLWLNLGDSYASGEIGRHDNGSTYADQFDRKDFGGRQQARLRTGLKPKDLCMIPARVALALQAPYYTGRIADERDRVWMAATLDAEGTICGFRHVRPDGNIRTGCLVFITNGSEAMLDNADRIWPGARYIDTLKTGDEVMGAVARHDCWRWEIQKCEERSAFVREMYPYLVVKKRQAMVAWTMLEMVKDAKRMGRGGETAAIKEKRDYLAKILSDLNQRRPVDLPNWLKEPPSLHEPGWYLRSEVIWSKKNPMPESVTDRPTKAHEQIYLLTKAERYYYDAEAIAEASLQPFGVARLTGQHKADAGGFTTNGQGASTLGSNRGEATRNKRSVWHVATQPYPEAHFATFPEALIEPCILAGTSEKGCCPQCGAPWARIVERNDVDQQANEVIQHDGVPGLKRGTSHDRVRSLSGATYQHVRRSTDKLQPTCACDAGDPVPCTVLDPFCGSGTTGAVAIRHQRHFIGVELNPAYVQLARRRINAVAPLFSCEGEATA